MWQIPLFDLTFDEQEVEAVQEILRSGWLTMGAVTEKFEQSFAECIGVKHALAISNGTAALHLAHLALGIGDDDEVICPSLTFVAGANAIVYTGAKPVFADITSYDNLNISPEDIQRKITSKTKAIQVVHYAGYPCDMERIITIADQFGLPVIEDCAHAPGAEYGGKKCGALGKIGCFSFFSNKNMTTAEGGMITTNSDQLAAKIRLLRSHGMTSLTLDRYRGHAFSYNVVEFGYNYRIDEIRSALGMVQLKKLHQNNNKRHTLVQIYREKLAHIDGVQMPFTCHVGFPSDHIFPILLEKDINRQKFMEYLKKKEIQTSVHYPPIHLFDVYRCRFGCQEGMLPLTEAVAAQEVTLPLYPLMTEKAVHDVCDLIIEFLQGKRN